MQNIHVCHVAMGDLWAGAEVQLAGLVRDLIKRPGLQLSVVLFSEGRLSAEVRALGVPVSVFPESEWSEVKIFRQLLAYCRTTRLDILHTHKYKDNILATLAAARTRIPYVVRTIHGLSEPFGGIEAIRMWVNECCDEVANRMGVNRIIAVSSQIERVLSQKYGRGKVVQIHNGICLNRVRLTKSTEETRKGLGLTTGRRLIGTVGRLTAVKGHAHFLLAARQLLEDGEDLHFVIVGDGPLLDQLREKAEELGIKDNVMFLGHRDDTYDLLRAMDIFVLPSLHEGIPMVMLEAMALARPVVASRVGGIPEVLTDQVHGLLVSAGNPVELTRACEKFLKNQVLAESCGRAGQMRIEQEFSSEAMGEKVASLYQELVRSK